MFDLDQLLAPIPGGGPPDDPVAACGVDLRATPDGKSQLSEVESAFRAAAAARKRLDIHESFAGRSSATDAGAPPPEEPNWVRVVELAVPILAERSKDLHVAVWLGESSFWTDGLDGLTAGFRLLAGLCERYWPHLFPREIDPDDLHDRQLTCLRPMYFQSERLLNLLEMKVPVTSAGTGAAIYDQASFLERLNDAERQKRMQGLQVVRLAQIRDEAQASGADFYRRQHAAVKNCQEALRHLDRVLQARCGERAELKVSPPSFEAVIDRLQMLAKTLEDLAPAGALVQAAATSGESSVAAAAEASAPGTTVALTPANLNSREAAFEQLRQIAAFFRTTEPHSPVSYALEQAIRWGHLSLPELLNELIDNTDLRQDLFRRTGIPRDDEAGGRSR